MRILLALALLTSACATVPAAPPPPPPDVVAIDRPVPAVRPAPPPPPAPPLVSMGMQWLYGAGEGAASSIQTYRAFRDHVLAATRRRPTNSVILAEGADPSSPAFVPCGRKPLAVVLDVDETVIQNLGYEYALAKSGKAADGAALNRWQKAPRTEVKAMPGAVEALNAVKARGVTVIYNTNRDDEDAEATAKTIANAGLPPGVIKETLFHRGDVDGQSSKDGRRTYIAGRYCVVAMVGDQLGDFSEQFNVRGLPVQQRRALAERGPIASLWGNGWFLLSNPAYGPGLRGRIDEIYPPEVRWTDPGEVKP
ncbi:MAG TPA: HAD family acid phosphatase [Sphingomicrobium sp.]|nr:HAD family acid phosphatase [Sphingomicrobium sp.]